MSTPVLTPDASVLLDGAQLTPARGSTLTLDRGAVPYASASVVLPLLPADILGSLDPRSGVRCPLTFGGRAFDLGLRQRTVDHRAKTVTLTLASDEAILIKYKPLTEDATPFTLAHSIRAIVQHVLAQAVPDAVLAPGPDADVTPRWPATNLLRNPALAGNVNNWTAGGGCTISYVAQGSSGYVRAAMTGANGAVFMVDTTKYDLNASPEATYNASVKARCEVPYRAGETARLVLRFLDNNNAPINSVFGPPVQMQSGEYRTLTVSARAPANAAKVAPYISINGSTLGRVIVLDAGLLYEGDPRFPVEPFTGGDLGDDEYTYAFEGDPDDSPSVRTPVGDPGDPYAFVWDAGESGWDFLLPLVTSVGMVLWCDEARLWHLDLPEARSIPDQINVAASTASEGEDTLTADDENVWVTGIIVMFKWTRNGTSYERADVAGTPGSVRTVELNRPYVPGIAQAMLFRLVGTGRTQSVRVLARSTATPGMVAQISLPGAPDTLGQVAAVRWDLAEMLMDLETTGLIDIAPGDWLDMNGTTDWADVDPDLDWEDA
ncbi:hypothetical protein E4V99_14015 [Microbacterium sp. dk485]|uniref:hypothetical protein n=1 Tax=Microbacterium sp. dk485 TaxID=2560021 RepID=UPI001073AA0B|nr:hypothetical protein [Microbacterium sp. dk485]TFV82045.1 hypothetical protein E4V99_14015 [Microbacterium sp. dk485]